MKLFVKPFLALFALTAILSSCDVEKLIDEKFKDKSLVVLAPDFIQNRVTVILKDEETNEIVNEELKVTVYSNKKIIDLSGNYKNSFTIKNGILNFALDPNEEVSSSDPWEFDIYSMDETKKFRQIAQEKKVTNRGNKTLLFYQKLRPNIEALAEKSANTNKNLRYETDLYLTYNDMKWIELFISKGRWQVYDDVDRRLQDDGYLNVFVWILDKGALEEDLKIKIKFTNAIALNTFELLKLSINYTHDGFYYQYKVDSQGQYFVYSSFGLEGQGDFDFNKGFIIPKGAKLEEIVLKGNLNNYYGLEDCSNGYNFEFSGVPKNTNLNFEYKTLRDGPGEGYISSIGYANLSNENKIVNTGDHFQSSNSNKVVFAEHPQYIIEPQEMDLGGKDACGQTYNFKVYPRDGHNRYKLNVQFQCSGEDFSTAPSVVAFLNEESSSTESSLIQFSNGSANLVLKPNAKYLVEGVFNETPFGFTFTANEDNVAEAISSTIVNNDNILDIEYSISKLNNIESVINAKVIFKEGQCPE